MFLSLVKFVLFSTCIGAARAATYSLSDNIVGTKFLSEFTHQAISDPTHGRVNYVDQSTALAENLTFATSNTFIIRGDHKKTLSASGPGRDSVRIQSNKQYSTHVAVFDIVHMPRGCGTWPAVWEVGNNWPYGGEVDIVEGVNDVSPNQATLHTGPGMSSTSCLSGTRATAGTDCNSFDNSNAGCGVKVNKANSYGPPFDSNGGGWYAMERTSSHINVYFWPRNDGSVPSDVRNGASTINTGNWGTPVANFPSSNGCNINSAFAPNNIIINLTFCGDWAGASSVYAASGCPSTCVADYVNNNPSAFVNAYFQFNALRVYT
ncbi:glycoside hydrolase family 16 protein [Fomitiporia mediterranea MF3/22]|uniref:glycoside hydrolase family 16 protein n=1 Tax=Fomitiporia mediterranea (strain MF3/22) TaxID=694068 RepID=UPI0004408E4F|nr:glycoside hydrolase family 16 protein [Fomitiporia mediterranea MF3/22]EJD04695.1 glycoside hydrolase family 16 protein [Fomitiporia mediterranea MF3/22]